MERPNSVCWHKRGGACLYGWATIATIGGGDLASPVFWTPYNPHAEDMQQRTLHDDQSGWKENFYTVGGSVFKILCDTNADAIYLCGSYIIPSWYNMDINANWSGAMAFLNLKTIIEWRVTGKKNLPQNRMSRDIIGIRISTEDRRNCLWTKYENLLLKRGIGLRKEEENYN